MLLSDWSHLYGIPYTVLRYGIPYGPRMRDELVIAKFIGKLKGFAQDGHGSHTVAGR